MKSKDNKHDTNIKPVTIDNLMYHYTDDYLDSYNLVEIEKSIILIKDCHECQESLKCLEIIKRNKYDLLLTRINAPALAHLEKHLEIYKTQYLKLDTLLHLDNTLSDAVKNDMTTRKQAIINFLLSNETSLRTKVSLENKIVQIDNKLTRANSDNAPFKTKILSTMETLKREMFTLDDIILCHMRHYNV